MKVNQFVACSSHLVLLPSARDIRLAPPLALPSALETPKALLLKVFLSKEEREGVVSRQEGKGGRNHALKPIEEVSWESGLSVDQILELAIYCDVVLIISI